MQNARSQEVLSLRKHHLSMSLHMQGLSMPQACQAAWIVICFHTALSALGWGSLPIGMAPTTLPSLLKCAICLH